MLSEIIERMTSRDVVEQWKRIAAREMRAFAKRARPFRGIKPTGYYLYIDTKALTYGIILRGVKPNAAAVNGFSAPVGKYKKVQRYHARTAFGWRTFDKERETSPRAGVEILKTEYYGVSARMSVFFGLRRAGKKVAFGLADGVAVPVYSESGFVEWITDTQADELARILADAGFAAIDTE